MKKYLLRMGFNLIEVTMAIAIVGIGIAGVMALFPPAIEANKNANFQNFTGTVVNNVAAYLDYQLKKKDGGSFDWDKGTGAFKDKFKTKDDPDSTKPNSETNTDGWNEITGFTGVYKTSQNKDDLLGIKSYDGSIAAHVRIWQDNSHMSDGYFNQSAVTIDNTNTYRIKLIIELSWPIAKAYADREKQEFVYEFNKPE